MVKLDVVYLIGCSRLESLVDEIEFSVGDPKLLVIEYRPESCVLHESTVRLVLILEEGLYEQSSVSYISAYSLHASIQLHLLLL